MKILVIDNYDSFTYNLVHILKELSGSEVDVFRNDAITLDEIGNYNKIVISPGPGVPDQAGITKSMIKHFGSSKSILGVCLGCQAIAEAYGGSLINLKKVYHGVETDVIIEDTKEPLFKDIPVRFRAGRYHSWIVNEKDLPTNIKITAKDDEGYIMGISHTSHDVRGVQFHPESVMTIHGKQMLQNWIKI
ncbi:MAG TPA: aminodeoxychorismate/anthranilate synthase component II [Bacteroidales bacterium]|nr:aminodeoxychorismate/anthranilate synthase component II [Bacteroidales bacterium]